MDGPEDVISLGVAGRPLNDHHGWRPTGTDHGRAAGDRGRKTAWPMKSTPGGAFIPVLVLADPGDPTTPPPTLALGEGAVVAPWRHRTPAAAARWLTEAVRRARLGTAEGPVPRIRAIEQSGRCRRPRLWLLGVLTCGVSKPCAASDLVSEFNGHPTSKGAGQTAFWASHCEGHHAARPHLGHTRVLDSSVRRDRTSEVVGQHPSARQPTVGSCWSW